MAAQVQANSWDSKTLRTRFLDSNRHLFAQETLNAVAHMLIEIDRHEHVMEIALSYLAQHLAVGRVDIGFGSHRLKLYSTAAEHLADGAPSMFGIDLPNKSQVLQRVWLSPNPIAYHDIRNNPLIGGLQESFKQVGSRAILAQRLDDEEGAYGIVYIDDLESGRTWQSSEQCFVMQFCQIFLAPVLSISRRINTQQHTDKPSPAELDAVRLAAQGLSYKQIAATLNKSIRTIEFQLRSARSKTGASNQTELVQRCQYWL